MAYTAEDADGPMPGNQKPQMPSMGDGNNDKVGQPEDVWYRIDFNQKQHFGRPQDVTTLLTCRGQR